MGCLTAESTSQGTRSPSRRRCPRATGASHQHDRAAQLTEASNRDDDSSGDRTVVAGDVDHPLEAGVGVRACEHVVAVDGPRYLDEVVPSGSGARRHDDVLGRPVPCDKRSFGGDGRSGAGGDIRPTPPGGRRQAEHLAEPTSANTARPNDPGGHVGTLSPWPSPGSAEGAMPPAGQRRADQRGGRPRGPPAVLVQGPDAEEPEASIVEVRVGRPESPRCRCR